MSRYYEMDVNVEDVHDKATGEKIIAACEEEFEFDDSNIVLPTKKEHSVGIGICGRGNLCGGEGEDAFVDRITGAIWKAVGRFVPVRVTCTYLEDLPQETYELGKEEYELFLIKQKEEAE